MSLVACRECGQEVSTEAATCPHCGCANPAVSQKAGCGGFVFLLLALAVVAALVKAYLDGHLRF